MSTRSTACHNAGIAELQLPHGTSSPTSVAGKRTPLLQPTETVEPQIQAAHSSSQEGIASPIPAPSDPAEIPKLRSIPLREALVVGEVELGTLANIMHLS